MAWFTNREQKGQIYIFVFAILLVLVVVAYMIFGLDSIFRIIVFIGEALLLISALFLIAYFFYWLFIKKHKFDVNYVNKQKLIEACGKLKRPILKDMYVTGDNKHTRAKVGKIQGYARIQILTRKYLFEKVTDENGKTYQQQQTVSNERGEKIPVYELESIEQDVFTVKEGGLMGMFKDPMVIRTNPEDHNELIGDVDLFGFSLIPISEYWFLNTDHLDVRKIDYAILKEAERTISFVVLSDMRELIDKATGVDARHRKEIERKSLVEIPETKSTGQSSPYQ